MRLCKNNEAWPVIYHGNGVSKKEEIFTALELMMKNGQDWQESHPQDEDITVLTWSIPTEETILQDSFKKMGIEDSLNIIPIEKPFNWLDKIKKTMEFLDTVDTKYVMGLDATDIIVSTDEQGRGKLWSNIIESFEGFYNAKLLWNAEKNNWPSSDGRGTSIEEDGMNGYLMSALKETETFEERIYADFLNATYFRLNSGAFIGETEYTKLFYDKLWNDYVESVYDKGFDESFFGGDQGFVRIMQKDCFPDMVLDYKCKIFHTFSNVRMEDIDGIYE